MNFRRNIIKLRKEHGMTQDDLANKLSLSRQSVQKWESGESTPDLSRLGQIAKLFEISVDDLLSGDADGPTNALKAKKKKLKTIRLIYAAVILAAVGFFVLVLPNHRAMIPYFKLEMPMDQAQQYVDDRRDIEAITADNDNCEILSENSYVCTEAYTGEDGVSTWITVVDEWDTRGTFCHQDTNEAGLMYFESCIIKHPEDPWTAILEWRGPLSNLTNQIAILIFMISAYIAAYAFVKYKFGNFAWCITQIGIFGLLFIIGVVMIINEIVFQIYPGLGVWEIIIRMDREFLLPIIGLIGIGYPLLSIIFLGKKNLDK